MKEENLIQPTADMVTYDRYLKISELVKLQHPLSSPEEHDETLFIVIHQVYELWFKQILHEVGAAVQYLKNYEPMPFMRALKRVIMIQETLTQQVDILETMAPNDFNRFRERLNPASGFQSMQFRQLEFLLGAKNVNYLKFYNDNIPAQETLKKALAEPTLYDYFFKFMVQRGFKIPESVLNRDVSKAYEASAEVEQIFLSVYQNPSQNYDLFLLLETMLDFDQKFLLWRYRHVSMVERMIGGRRGTGGSSGVEYLMSTMSKRFFPEIWYTRNLMK
jgi:tryptophan 2,3-dioxygenase